MVNNNEKQVCPKCFKRFYEYQMIKARSIFPRREKYTELVCSECSWLGHLFEVTDAERLRQKKKLSKAYWEALRGGQNV